MRKESSNQFTEGLVCDLNPINTPNTVLTDALNATIITYDGNEFSLQNDRGNYPLENCKLKPNYIPVGLKEYGDILYIMSYNPLDNKVEIGTYPSPVELVTTDVEDSPLNLDSVIGSASYKDDKIDYSELIENCETKIWTTEDEEKSKLYPGDQYKIEESNPSPYKYEALEYFIIDENRKKFNISDLIEKDNEWHSVSWQIPGWLATQYRIATFDDFTMSVRSMQVPKLGTEKFDGKVKLNFQLNISDQLFLQSDEQLKLDLYIKVECKEKGISEEISLTKGRFLDWYKDSKILWIDETIAFNDLSFGDTLTIVATPFLRLNVDDKERDIIYDKFSESYSFYLNSIGSYSDFQLGKSIWKFYIDEDDLEHLYLEYDIVGPNVTKEDVQLYYRILDIQNKVLTPWSKVEDYTGITNHGVGIIKFTDPSFTKENMYVLEFVFYKNDWDLTSTFDSKSFKKLVVASQIFSDFVGQYSNFNDISFDEWINKFSNSVVSENWDGYYAPDESTKPYKNYSWKDRLIIDDKSFDSKNINNLLTMSYKDPDKGLFTESEYQNVKNKTERLIVGEERNLKIHLTNTTKALQGDLWKGTPAINIEISTFNNTDIEQYKRDTIKSDLEITSPSILGKYVDISYVNKESFLFTKGIERITNIPILHLHTRPNNDNWNEGVTLRLERYGYWQDGKFKDGDFYSIQKKECDKYVNIGNDISKNLLSFLGDNQMGMLCVTVMGLDLGEGYFQLRHGTTQIIQFEDNSDCYLFTYLVFRKRLKYTNGVVLIPLEDHKEGLSSKVELWHKKISDNETDTFKNKTLLFNLRSKIEDYLNKFTDGIRICSESNAVSEATLVNLNYSDQQSLDVCNVSIYTPSFSTWMCCGYNLLSYNDRQKIMDLFGNEVTGKLLIGNTSQIDKRLFGKFALKNNESSNNYDFSEIKNNIEIINNSVKRIESEAELLDKLSKRSETKGVYWIGENNLQSLINLLNSNYSTSGIYLTADSANLADANVCVTGEEDGLVFAHVDTIVNAAI